MLAINHSVRAEISKIYHTSGVCNKNEKKLERHKNEMSDANRGAYEVQQNHKYQTIPSPKNNLRLIFQHSHLLLIISLESLPSWRHFLFFKSSTTKLYQHLQTETNIQRVKLTQRTDAGTGCQGPGWPRPL